MAEKKDRLQNFVYSGESNMTDKYTCSACGKKFALQMGHLKVKACPFCKEPVKGKE